MRTAGTGSNWWPRRRPRTRVPGRRPPSVSRGLFADTVTANDGRLDRLLGVLDTEANGEGCISAERFLVDVGDTTVEVTGEDGGAELRERQED